MSRAERVERVGKEHKQLSVREQCELLELNRSTMYYEPVGPSQDTLDLLRCIDRIFTDTPFFGARRIREALRDQGHSVSRNRIRRLMKLMELKPSIRVLERASRHLDTRSTLTCSRVWRSIVRTRFGLPTLAISPCAEDSSTLWLSSIGTADMSWRGPCQILLKLISVWTH
jgi:hypothetical protein